MRYLDRRGAMNHRQQEPKCGSTLATLRILPMVLVLYTYLAESATITDVMSKRSGVMNPTRTGAGARALSGSLASPAPPPPPAAHVLSWTLEAGLAAVVDMGAGERWLRPMHARAAAPLLLWRPPARSLRGSAPAWLERCRAYVFAASDVPRLHDFMDNDTLEAVRDETYWAATGNFYRQLQFTSSARTVVALLIDPEKYNTAGKRRMLKYYIDTMRDSLLPKHESYLVYLYMEIGNFRNGHLRLMGEPRIDVMSPSRSCYGRACTIKNGHELHLAKMKGQVAMMTALVDPEHHIAVDTTELGIRHVTSGLQQQLLTEIGKKFRVMWVVDEEIQKKNNTMKKIQDWKRVEKLLYKSLEEESIEFSPHSFLAKDRPFSSLDIIGGSAWKESLRIAVPRASELPAWSVPFRAFGGAIWLALGGAAAAYALAWRAVAGASLAEGAAAALRAFSSCGGAPQGRVGTSPQRLQLAGALLASAAVVVAAYQAHLFTLIMVPQRFSETDSFEELSDSGLTIVSLEADNLRLLVNPTETHLREKLEARKMTARLPRRVISTKELETLQRHKSIALVMTENELRKLADFNERNWFRVMKDTVEDNLKFTYARRSWILTGELNALYLQYSASGLLKFWEDCYFHDLRLVSRVARSWRAGTSHSLWKDTRHTLSLADVHFHLLLLTVGLLLAMIAFCEERRRSRKSGSLLREERGDIIRKRTPNVDKF